MHSLMKRAKTMSVKGTRTRTYYVMYYPRIAIYAQWLLCMFGMMSAPMIKWNPNVQDVATSNAAPLCVRFSGDTCTAMKSPTLASTKLPTSSPAAKEPTGAPTCLLRMTRSHILLQAGWQLRSFALQS